MKGLETRQQIVEVADVLFYRQGFDHTSFASIASEVGISRGNFYYHFKTKDEILDAVIQYRLEKTQLMLDQWQMQGSTPRERILCFINILVMNKAKIKQFGCPVGTLTSELSKLTHPAHGDATQLFSLFESWLSSQFSVLGFGRKSKNHAMHLLARSQGIATLISAFQDEQFIRREIKLLEQWLDDLIQEI